MTKYRLNGYFGSVDKTTSKKSSAKEEVSANFNFLYPDNKHFKYGIDELLKQLKRLKLKPSETGLDLLLFAIMVQAADTRLNRLQASQDAWCREIIINMPVSDLTSWNAARANLENMLRFLTGDRWQVQFRERPGKFKQIFDNTLFPAKSPYKNLNLFSGGLDSLIGAIDNMESGETPLFISHAGDASVSGPQKKVFDQLVKSYQSMSKIERVRLPSGVFPKKLFGAITPEASTRGRSFLFFALGCFVGTAFKHPFTLCVPENGLIALNIPLDANRLGASSTRTTHPYYMHRWNELLSNLKIEGTVQNPYWNKTKGEMIEECINQSVLGALIKDSVSCAHPSWVRRWKAVKKSHCGTCVPCLIRRSAINHAWGKDKDPTGYLISDLEKKVLKSDKSEGNQIRSFQLAIKNLKDNPDRAKIIIYKSGPLKEDTDKIDEFVQVYSNGMLEVDDLLKNVRTKPS